MEADEKSSREEAEKVNQRIGGGLFYDNGQSHFLGWLDSREGGRYLIQEIEALSPIQQSRLC